MTDKMKTNTLSILITLALSATHAQAATFRFSNEGTTDDWADGQNWINQGDGDSRGTVPGIDDVARFNYGGAAGAISSDVGSINGLQIGVDESGTLTVGSGGALTTTAGDFSGLGIGGGINTGTLNLSGGSLTFNNIFHVALGSNSTGILNLNSGMMRVDDQYIHNVNNEAAAIATSNLFGGLLDVNSMTLNSGVFDVSGGTLRLRNGDQTAQVNTWETTGLMTANGGSTGSSLRASYDSANDWTTVVAVPEPSSALLCGLAGLSLLVRRRK